ncbi:MAG: outer membrane protein assembly factor BamD [Alphaproteobacteria bacterium]|nr:outer membrane protein assembly factor BamD [Alphaproteobacteria bacterium]
MVAAKTPNDRAGSARNAPGRLTRHLCLLLCLTVLAGCDTMKTIFGTGEEEHKHAERSVEEIYNNAMDLLQTGWYETAAKEFDEVERQHPYSVWATKAQLMAGYSHYKDGRYDEAIISLDRFIELHPGNRDAPYAYYLKALSYYEQISDVGRDQKMTRLALDAMREVVRRFPNSSYARDARLKLELSQDHLAGKDMAIGRYYQRRTDYLAAINRYRAVIERYQTTTHVPEALHRLTECYLALGITDEAQMSAAVLGHNFPGSQWYEDSYAMLDNRNLRPQRKESSWLSWMWDWAT